MLPEEYQVPGYTQMAGRAALNLKLRGADSSCLPSQCSQSFHICSPLFRSLNSLISCLQKTSRFCWNGLVLSPS